MDARREGKLRKKAPTEYETTPVFFSGSNPDASSKHASVAQLEDGIRFKPCTVLGSNPAGGTNKIWPGDVIGNRVRLKSEILRVQIPPGLQSLALFL